MLWTELGAPPNSYVEEGFLETLNLWTAFRLGSEEVILRRGDRHRPELQRGTGDRGLAGLAVLKEGGSHRTQLWRVQATPAFASGKGGTGPSNGLVPFIE